jgi:cell cycle sensor histidine kinase DivJ
VTVEFRVRRGGWGEDEAPADRFITVEMRCRPAVDESGKAKAAIAVIRDVSDRKARESELRAAREAAERANLAKGSFLAHMSHELRTPLNAIIGFSEILDRSPAGAAETERRREYAKLIRVSGEHLLEVVNGILDISKLESGMFDISLEPISVAPVLEGCCEMMGHQAAERGVSLVRSAGAHLPRVQADPRAVRQIVLNLLSNAIKFTGRGGTVRVEARVEGATLALSVSDDGIGISADDIPRLGTPFVQVDSSYERRFEGTGLGLSIVKGLVALHQGSLSINSAVGVGTTVTVVLRLAEAETEDEAAVAPYAALLAGQHKELKRA